ncbi:MAG: ribosome maturation factor RimM [Oscillospiraceae bacterium]|jgi:16S rRNA processing protein RimM|nr:ribosome maturation factor RimM [Oscillospiraceae bacterium]
MVKRYLECGKIVSTHGVRGEIRVEAWCDGPEELCALPFVYLNGGETPLKILGGRVHKGMALLFLEGVATLDSANRLRGKILWLDREDVPLPKGKYFLQDLMGLRVLNADTKEEYGLLSDVFETGANDVYEITGPDGGKRLIPAIPQVIAETDVAGGIILIRPLKGLFDDAD